MRIPYVRSGGDETPWAWWEWLFAPIALPLFAAFLLVLVVVSVPVVYVGWLWQRREEKQLRRRLAEVGRFVEWDEVETKLKAGEGTLIIEDRSPKRLPRAWWTEDDLVAAAPVPLPASLNSAPEEAQPLQDYARACSARYVDLESGTAKLTAFPVPPKRFDPRMYPQGKVVTLVMWPDEPILFKR
jgi:hypothetical protein